MGCSKSIVGNDDSPQSGKNLIFVKHLTFCEAMGRWLAIRRGVALEVRWPFEVYMQSAQLTSLQPLQHVFVVPYTIEDICFYPWLLCAVAVAAAAALVVGWWRWRWR